jgi:hypothetical protein
LKHTRKHEKGRGESNQEAKHTGSGGPSGQEGRTVRVGPGPSATEARTVREPAATKTKSQTGSKRNEARTRRTPRRTGAARIVRLVLADRPPGADRAENARPRKSTSPNHHRISQTVEAMETRVWGLQKHHTRML